MYSVTCAVFEALLFLSKVDEGLVASIQRDTSSLLQWTLWRGDGGEKRDVVTGGLGGGDRRGEERLMDGMERERRRGKEDEEKGEGRVKERVQ